MILGIASATDRVSVALVANGEVMVETTLDEPRGGVEKLPELLTKQLEFVGRDAGTIQAIGIVVGPGSYTGLRGGVALAHGLAAVSNLPVVPLQTLPIIAEGCPLISRLLCVILDSVPTECHVAFFPSAPGIPLTDELIVPIIKLASLWGNIRPGCAVVYGGNRKEIIQRIPAHFDRLPTSFGHPRASVVAQRAEIEFRNGKALAAEKVLPIYAHALKLKEYSHPH